MIPILFVFLLNISFAQEISDISTKIKYEILSDEIAMFGYDAIVEKNNRLKEVQDQYARFLSYNKSKSDEKKAILAMEAKKLEIRKKFGKRINFSGVVYKILYSYGDIPNSLRMCNCGYCILNKSNAGQIIGNVKPAVKIIGNEYDIIQIYAPYGGYEHFLKISKSKIVFLAKKMGFKKIIYDTFIDYQSVVGIDNHFQLLLK